MRAAVIHGRGDLRLEEVPEPEAGPGELLLAVETVGICGTDSAELAHGPHQFPLDGPHPVTGHQGPMIPGHELSGRVVSMGLGVAGFREGDLVACAGSVGCGRCRWCRSARPSRCQHYWAVGLHRHGGLAELCAVPADACLVVDPGVLTADAAALAQPMSIGVHVVRRSRAVGGEEVIVVGAGGAGVFVAYAAVTSGCNVEVWDLDEDRLAVASALGVATTVRVDGVIPPEAPTADIVFEVTGSAAGLRSGLSRLSPGGRLVVVGFQAEPFPVDLVRLTLREQEVIGSNGIDAPIDLPEAVRLLAARGGSWRDVAPGVIPLEHVSDALSGMARGERGPIKTLVSPRVDRPRPARM